MFREVELSHESLVPKTLQLDREFILYPNLEFEEVDLGNRRKALRKGEKDQELVYSLDEFIQFAAENKQNLESEFKILELKYTKESFLLDLKQRKALQELHFLVDIGTKRRKLGQEMQCIDYEINQIISLPCNFSPAGYDPFLETIFLEEDFLSLSEFIDKILRPHFPGLFYDNRDLKRLLNGFGDEITLSSFADTLNGKYITDFLKPFRLKMKDLDRALHEINQRLREKHDYKYEVIVCSEDNFYQTILHEEYVDILEAALNADIRTSEMKGQLLINAIKGKSDSLAELIFQLITPDDPKSKTINFQLNDERSLFDGMTPFHFAVLHGKLSVVNELIKRNASIRHVSVHQTSIFHLVCRLGRKEIFLKIMKYANELGFSPAAILNTQDKRGFTCVHEAASNGKIGIIRYLSSIEGVNFDALTVTGRSASDLAFGCAGVLWEFLENRKKKHSNVLMQSQIKSSI